MPHPRPSRLAAALLLSAVACPAQPQPRPFPQATAASTQSAEPAPAVAASPDQQLTRLLTAHQAALDAADSPAILATGRTLGALALRLAADLNRPSQPTRAVELYRQSLVVEDTLATHLDLVLAQLAAGQSSAANAEVARIIATTGDTPRLHLLLSSAHHSAHDLPGTIAELTRALALDPSLAAAHLALGDAFLELNEFQYNPDSLREFTAAQRLDPGSYLPNYDLGAMLSQYQRFAEAAPFLERAAAADPASPDPWLQLGMNADAQDHDREALTALERCIALTPADPARGSTQLLRVYALLSRIHAAQGDTAGARQLEARAAQLHAEHLRTATIQPLSESTGLLTSNSPRSAIATASAPALTSAQQQIERQLQSIAAGSLNDAGTALARARDYVAALPLFREAAVADPALAPATRNLGLAAFHTAHYDEAIAAFTRTLAREPGDTLARSLLDQSRALAMGAPPAP